MDKNINITTQGKKHTKTKSIDKNGGGSYNSIEKEWEKINKGNSYR